MLAYLKNWLLCLVVLAAVTVAVASGFGQTPQLFAQGTSEPASQQGQVQQPLPLGNPTGLHAELGDVIGEVLLRWTPARNATAYWVWAVKTDETVSRVYRSDGPEITIDDLEPGKEYWFAVLAFRENENGEIQRSRLSNWIKFAVEGPPKFKSLSTGWDHSCAILTDGTLDCWGSNWVYKTKPPEGRYRAVSVHGNASCAINLQREVWCWGEPPGDGAAVLPFLEPESHSIGVPRKIFDGRDFVQISTSMTHTCALRANGKLVCKGRGNNEEILNPNETYRSVAGGWDRTCALKVDRTVSCWGAYYDRNLDAEKPYNSVADARKFRSIDDSCGVTAGTTDGGHIVCWVDAVGKHYGHSDLVLTAPNQQFQSVSKEGNTVCGLTNQGIVHCYVIAQRGHWTEGRYYWEPWLSPEGTFQSVDVGIDFACALSTSGDITCWGYDGERPATPPDKQFLSVTAGNFLSCGILSTGAIDCWGSESGSTVPAGRFKQISTQCGVMRTWDYKRQPSQIVCWGGAHVEPPPGRFDSVSVGGGSACALRWDSTIVCWPMGRDDPIAQPPTGEFRSISYTGYYGCGIRFDGTVECWGNGYSGSASPPQGTFTSVSASGDFTCGVRTDGTVECWGYTSHWTTPVPEGKFQSVSSTSAYACGVRENGELACWGYDYWAFRSYGRTTPPSGTYISVSTATDHACAVEPIGNVVCWGYDGDRRATPPGGKSD